MSRVCGVFKQSSANSEVSAAIIFDRSPVFLTILTLADQTIASVMVARLLLMLISNGTLDVTGRQHFLWLRGRCHWHTVARAVVDNSLQKQHTRTRWWFVKFQNTPRKIKWQTKPQVLPCIAAPTHAHNLISTPKTSVHVYYSQR